MRALRWLFLLVLVAAGIVAFLVFSGGPRDGATERPDADAQAAGPGVDERSSGTAEERPSASPRDGDGDGARRRVDAGAGATPPGEGATPTSSELAGVVVDHGGAPMPGVSVTLVRGAAVPPPPKWADDVLQARVIAERGTPAGPDGRFGFTVRSDEAWLLVIATSDGLSTSVTGVGPDDLGRVSLPQPIGPVTCRVVDEDTLEPIPDAFAYVYANADDVVAYRRVESRDGVLAFTLSPQRILVTAPGYGFETRVRPLGDRDIELMRGYDIAGVIVDEDGKPYADTVTVLTDDNQARASRTSADGAFSFPDVVSYGSGADISIAIDGRAISRHVAVGDTHARIVIPRGGDIRGVVVMPDGTPAAGAIVEDRTVGEDGRFVMFTNGQASSGTVVARVMGRVPGFDADVLIWRGTERYESSPGSPVELRIELTEEPYSFVRVRVLDDSEKWIGGSVSFTAPWQGTAADSQAIVGVVGLPPGSEVAATVGAYDTGLVSVGITLTTSARPDGPVTEVRLARAGPVTVRFFDPHGDEIPRADWTQFHVEGYGATIRDDGRVDTSPGAYVRVVIEANGLRFDDRLSFPVKPPWELDVRTPPPVSVLGRLVHRGDRPAANVSVVVVLMGRTLTAYPRTVTDDNGHFVVRGVHPGRALFVAWGGPNQDEMAAQHVIEVPASGELDLGELVAWETVELTGRVSASNGGSVGGLFVRVHWANAAENEETRTDAEGHFRLALPSASDAVVHVSRTGQLGAVQAVDLARATHVNLRVVRTGTVRVVGPPAWSRVPWDAFVESSDGTTRWNPDSDTGADRRETILRDVPAGNWTIHAVGKGIDSRREIRVIPGEEARLLFD